VTCFITVPAYEFVCMLNCADFALDVGFFFGLIFTIVFMKNCVDKPSGLIRALNWLQPSATMKFFVAVTRFLR